LLHLSMPGTYPDSAASRFGLNALGKADQEGACAALLRAVASLSTKMHDTTRPEVWMRVRAYRSDLQIWAGSAIF
jgi:hypothetical protein